MIATKNGWGEVDVHEYHCNRCGYCVSGEGQIRSVGNTEGLTFLRNKGNKEF